MLRIQRQGILAELRRGHPPGAPRHGRERNRGIPGRHRIRISESGGAGTQPLPADGHDARGESRAHRGARYAEEETQRRDRGAQLDFSLEQPPHAPEDEHGHRRPPDGVKRPVSQISVDARYY